MTGDEPNRPGPLTPAALTRARDRAERRARALRDNLKRRKRQLAARAGAAEGEAVAGETCGDADRPCPDAVSGPDRGSR